MAPKGRRRPASSGPTSAGREWGHPEGFQLTEVDLDAEYDAVVTNVGPYGVFVDFGAVKDALLKVPVAVGRGLHKGMEVNHLVVTSCDPETGKVVLSPQESTSLPEPQPRKKSAGGGGRSSSAPARGASKDSRPRQRKPREWGHAEATPLEELQEGESWDGTVTNVSPYGVFVDIGAVRDARLNVPARVGRRFRIGDVVPDCRVETIDVENGRVSCVLEDPEEAVRDLEPKVRVSKAKGKAAPTRQSQAIATLPKAKAKAKAKQGATTIERLRVGQLVNGVVSNKGPYGIFVDIGVGKDAKLLVPKKMIPSFKRKDEIYDMRVESVDLEKVLIAVALDEPELVEEQQVAPRVSAAGKKAAAKPKAKPKAKQQKQDYSHPNALAISSFRVGKECNGFVTKVGPQGVYVDIGAERDAILKLPRELAKQFRVDDEVHQMTIEAVDVDNARITLSLEDPELLKDEPPAPARKALATRPEAKRASSAPASKAKSQPKAKPKAKGAGGKDWSHNEGTPLEELVVGSEVDGVVTNRGTFGVFLDIGAVKDGKLQLAKNQWRKFRKGDEVEQMVIDHVDLETEAITLTLPYELGDEPEEYIEQALPKPKAKPMASRREPQALTNGSAKAAPRPKSRSSAPARTGAAKSKAGARGSV